MTEKQIEKIMKSYEDAEPYIDEDTKELIRKYGQQLRRLTES